MDLGRRYLGSQSALGQKLEADLNSMQAQLDAAKKKKADQEHDAIMERFAWYDNYFGRSTKWHDLFRPKRKSSGQHVRIPKNA